MLSSIENQKWLASWLACIGLVVCMHAWARELTHITKSIDSFSIFVIVVVVSWNCFRLIYLRLVFWFGHSFTCWLTCRCADIYTGAFGFAVDIEFIHFCFTRASSWSDFFPYYIDDRNIHCMFLLNRQANSPSVTMNHNWNDANFCFYVCNNQKQFHGKHHLKISPSIGNSDS